MIAFDSKRLTSVAEMQHIVTVAAAKGTHQLSAFKAAAAGLIRLTLLSERPAALPCHVTDFDKPHLVIVGDDPPEGYGKSVGPEGWHCMRRLRYFQPRAAIVHASGGSAADYALAVEGARLHGRLLMIECSSAQGPVWGSAVEGWCPTAVLLPRNGQHPIQETRH